MLKYICPLAICTLVHTVQVCSSLFNEAVSNSDYILSTDWMMVSKWRGLGRKLSGLIV
jgi:hypothetical protein